MKKSAFSKFISFCLFLCICILIPSINVQAEAKNNFSVNVETDKTEYTNNEIVTYKITVKNITGKDSNELVVQDTLTEGVTIVETDGKVNGQVVTWQKDELKKDEEVVFNLKVKIESVTEPPVSDENKDQINDDKDNQSSIVVKPSTPDKDNNVKEEIDLPNTGGVNLAFVIGIGLILVVIGTWVYKVRGKKAGIALLLAFIFVASLFANTNVTYADSSRVKEKFSHVVKVDNKEVISTIIIEALINQDESEEEVDGDLLNPDNPKWNIDSDNDGLSDAEEELFGTNPFKADTDGDGLNDKFELESSLDPLNVDTDGNGILDCNEDIDEDKLSNLEEQKFNTSPIFEDTDGDGLSDYDEIKVYNTNPNKEDTDDDGLSDYDEIQLGTDLNNSDSNGNGIKDGDETYRTEVFVKDYEKDDNVEVMVSGEIKGEYRDDIVITNMEGTHSFITEDIPGYIGAPYRIGIYEENAEVEVTITFKVSDEVLQVGERIALYEYDATENTLNEVQAISRSLTANEIVINTRLINEYKEYVILISDLWEEAWNKEILEPNTEFSEMDIVLTIDSSGSMTSNDSKNLRKEGSINLINKLQGNNRAAVVDFDSSAIIRQSLTTDKDALISAINKIDSWGGTNISRGLAKAINALEPTSRSILTEESINDFYEDNIELLLYDEEQGTSLENEVDAIESREVTVDNVKRDKYIILLTDGQSTVNEDDPSLVYARENGIKIFTIGLGNEVEENTLRMIASTTGGKYLFATSADDLISLFDELVTQTIDLYTDSDNDGIPDYFERNLRLVNGVILQLDPNNPDSDGDGLSDAYEICGVDGNRDAFFSQYDSNKKAFNFISNPTSKDTDGDYILDGNGGSLENGSKGNVVDEEPRNISVSGEMLLKLADLSYEKLEKDNIGKKVKEISGQLGSDKYAPNISRDEIDLMTIINLQNGCGTFAGFGALAVKSGRNLIVSYPGTGIDKFDIGDIWADLFIVTDSNYQTKKAYKFMKDTLSKLKGEIDNIYISGHSLGGYLTQYMTYQCVENTFDDKSLVNNANIKAVTFNSPKFFSARALKNIVKPENPYDFDYTIFGEVGKYSEYVKNYRIDGDLVSKCGYHALGKVETLEDLVDGDIGLGIGPHSIYNFYKHDITID